MMTEAAKTEEFAGIERRFHVTAVEKFNFLFSQYEQLQHQLEVLKEERRTHLDLISNVLQSAVKREIHTVVRGTTDVAKMPKAQGISRVLQMLNLEILEEIDRVCRANDLKYWLAFGSALGAIRHGGHIPWDDDIDICMMYEDWMKFREVCKTQMREPYVNAVLPGDIGRVCRRDFMPSSDKEWIDFVKWEKTEKLFFGVDIFPVFWLKDDVTDEVARKLIREQSDIKQQKRWAGEHTVALWQKAHDEAEAALAPIIGSPGSSRVFLSLHTFSPNVHIWNSRDIFPLRDIDFEGKKVLTAGNVELQLLQMYGDYWDPVVTHTHLDVNQLSYSEKEKIVEQGKRLGVM